jgi:hypothetical protein
MKIRAIRCPNCRDIIYSRALHDFRECSCKSIYIFGGLEIPTYGRGMPEVELDLDVTRQELYDDWNEGKDKLGLIRWSGEEPQNKIKVEEIDGSSTQKSFSDELHVYSVKSRGRLRNPNMSMRAMRHRIMKGR